MQGLIVVLVLLLAAGALIGPILGWVALRRSRDVDTLARRVLGLEERVRRLAPKEPEPAARARVVNVPAAQAPEPALEAPPQPQPQPQPPPVPLVVEHEREDRAPVPATGADRHDLERWLGVRGAALLGGVALALAGLFFAQYAIQHGWFGPAERVTAGGVLGALLLLGRGRIARVSSELVADVLAGAGAVMGYASAWAAWDLHRLVSLQPAFAWMAAITSLTCLQSARHHRPVVALFGLVGGFATPLLLQTWDEPLDLFGYVLLLDLGLLLLARRERWRLIAPLALGGTALLQALWLLLVMGPQQTVAGLLVVGGFGLLFPLSAAAVGDDDESGRRSREFTRRAGLGLAGLFAVTFAARAELDVGIVPLGALLLLLSAAACELGRRHEEPVLASGAAGVSLTVLAIWVGAQGVTDATLARFAGAAIAFAGLFLADGRRAAPGRSTGERALPLLLCTFAGVLVLALSTIDHLPEIGIEPLAAGGVVLLGMLWLGLGPRAVVGAPAALSLALGAGLGWVAAGSTTDTALAVAHGLTAAVAGTTLLGLASARRADERARTWAAVAAAAVIVPVLLTAPGPLEGLAPFGGIGATGLVILAALAARASGSGRVQAAVAVAAAVAASRLAAVGTSTGDLVWVLAPALALLLPALRAPRAVLVAASAAPLLWLNPLVLRLADRTIGAPLVLLGLAVLPAALVAVGRARGLGREVAPAAASALVLAAFALTRWIDIEWIPVALTLAGAGALAVGAWSHEAFLRRVGVGAQVTGAVVLLSVAFLPGRFPSSAFPAGGALLGAYALPALALLAGAWCVSRPRTGGARHEASALVILCALLVFAWIDLAVADAFHEGERIVFVLARHEARDLTLSIAWVVYALSLLGIGTWTRREGLRWMSLGFTLLAVGKVFLYDLGELEGLYRVASMTGLALSLLVVSLLYSRVVFRREPTVVRP